VQKRVVADKSSLVSDGTGTANDNEGFRGAPSQDDSYLQWRIFARIRRFFRPTLRRPSRFFIGLADLS
jgi:hypothetical protein